MKLEKDMAEEMSQFKANYQRQFQDKDFELHRRVLHVEEDENRVKMQQDRLSDAEKRNKVILDEIEAQRKELDSLRRDNNKYTKETLEQKEQIRTLNENLKREADVSKNRESEARVYGQENRTLKKLLDDTKEDYGAHREDQ
jgi:chromosome segregation ATPase